MKNLLIFLLIAATTASVSHADFNIIGGEFKNQQAGPIDFDTDNDGLADIIMTTNEQLGITSLTPSANLHVGGNAQIDEHMSFLDLGSAPDTQSGNGLVYSVSGNLFYKDTSGSETNLSLGASLWTVNSGNIYRNSGYIGMGNLVPEARLHIEVDTAAAKGLIIEAVTSQSGALTEWHNASGATRASVTESGEFSNTVGQTQGEAFGDGASVSGIESAAFGYNASAVLNAVAVGASASAGGSGSIAIGRNSSAPGNGMSIGTNSVSNGTGLSIGTSASSTSADVVVGPSASGTLGNSVVIGNGALARRSSVAIGEGATTTASYADGIVVIGRGATATDTNQFVSGSNSYPVNNVFFGKGGHSDTPTNYTINGTAGTGTDIQGGDITIAGGRSTGNVIGGNIIFQTAAAGSTGSSKNSLAERMMINSDGNVGIGTGHASELLVLAGNMIPSANVSYNLGSSANNWNNVYSNNYIMISDRRRKENVSEIRVGLEEILKLKPVDFHWKGQSMGSKKIGFIAQEVESVIAEVVHTGDDQARTKGIHYTDLVPVLVKALQEQQKIIENQNRDMKQMRESFDARLKRLEAGR